MFTWEHPVARLMAPEDDSGMAYRKIVTVMPVLLNPALLELQSQSPSKNA